MLPEDFAIAVVNYRLVDEEMGARYPCWVEDVKAAVEWLVNDGTTSKLEEETRGNVWIVGHGSGAVSTSPLSGLSPLAGSSEAR